MSINQDLKALYAKYWNQLEIKANDIIKNENVITNQPVNPLLLKVDEKEYEISNLKVMIFGQETWGWSGKFGKSIEDGMNLYESFYIKEGFYKGRSKSAFWQGFDFFKNEISKQHSNKKIIYVWNNISKIGRFNSKGVTPSIRELERKYFPVINEEINILKPDIVVFLTGNRNNDIKFHFPDVDFKKYHNNATLSSRNGKIKFQPAYHVISKDLPNKSVKVYHPSYFGGFNNIKSDAMELII